ncbi:hypothetical protein BGZ54_009263 [Gamsiella multidivaricata]|nr:hypothetical protein BGZ54_009263 [Gamsiella multidivaricata]
MHWNTALFLVAAIAAPALALEEPSNCVVPATRNNWTSITDENNFCTMLSPKGSQNVAPDEACATSYCFGKGTTNPLKQEESSVNNPAMPEGLILSSHLSTGRNESGTAGSGWVQITGCMNGAVWGLNATDDGGQMDSHGWRYSCIGYNKFVSLLEPSSNTYCIRCCKGTKDDTERDCITNKSDKGCWNLIPGDYSMKDGSVCPLPNSTSLPTVSGTVSATATGSPTVSAPSSGSTSTGAVTSPTNKPSAAAHSYISWEIMATVVAGAIGIVAAF